MLYAVVLLFTLLAFPVMPENTHINGKHQEANVIRKYIEKQHKVEHMRVKRDMWTELRNSTKAKLRRRVPRQNNTQQVTVNKSSWLIKKQSQLMKGRKYLGEVKAKVIPPKCDQICKYVGELLQEAGFFAAAYCAFSTVAIRQWKALGEENIKTAEKISTYALLHYIDVANEIVTNEPRIKMENRTDITQACDRGELLPCNTTVRSSHESLRALKCATDCKGSSLCLELLHQQYELAEEEYFDKHDEMTDEEDHDDHETEEEHDDNDYL